MQGVYLLTIDSFSKHSNRVVTHLNHYEELTLVDVDKGVAFTEGKVFAVNLAGENEVVKGVQHSVSLDFKSNVPLKSATVD